MFKMASILPDATENGVRLCSVHKITVFKGVIPSMKMRNPVKSGLQRKNNFWNLHKYSYKTVDNS